MARFKIRIKDTGYAWNGGLRILLHAGSETLFPRAASFYDCNLSYGLC
jgi:hypothetical protein